MIKLTVAMNAFLKQFPHFKFGLFYHDEKKRRSGFHHTHGDTVLFIDGIPSYYSIDKKENKYSYIPVYENLMDPLPAFTIWNDGHDWWIDKTTGYFPDRSVIEQAIEGLNRGKSLFLN